MVLISYSGREINAKLVYYGPGLSGKTTNLEYIYGAVPQTHRGQMVSMKTKTERTLFFDFLPIDLGELAGFKTRFLLYTVPGQVYYNATRKLVLKGVDAVVFVADSKRGKMDENLESLANLRENLLEHGLELEKIPWVIQYNKRDLPDVYSLEELEASLNPGRVPSFEAVATSGNGVFETFKAISKSLLKHLSQEIGVRVVASAAGEAKPAETPLAQEPETTDLVTPEPIAVEPAPAAPIPQEIPVAEPAASFETPVAEERVEQEAWAYEEPAEPSVERCADGEPETESAWSGELLRANPVPAESHEEISEQSVFGGDESEDTDRQGTMGERLRRWFGHEQGRDEEPAETHGGPSEMVEPPTTQPVEERPEESAPSQGARIRPIPPMTAIQIEPAAAGQRQDAERREIPILVDLEPEDLERGVVLKLRIAMRAREDQGSDEEDDFPIARAA